MIVVLYDDNVSVVRPESEAVRDVLSVLEPNPKVFRNFPKRLLSVLFSDPATFLELDSTCSWS